MLTDLRALRFLMPFMAASHTLSSAAAVLDKRPSTVAYWLPRLMDCGLLTRLGDVARAGAPMPTYRARARAFTVPYPSIPIDRRVALLDEGRLRMLRRFMDGVDEELEAAGGFSLSFSGHGTRGTVVDLAETDGPRAPRRYTDGWQVLDLDDADGEALAAELEALVAKYKDRSWPASSTWCTSAWSAKPRFRWRSADDDLSD